MSPPRPFGHVLLFQHSPECLFITRRNRGNRGGVGWSGKGAGITLCHTPDCLETNRLLPSPNPALLCAWPEAPAQRGGCWCQALCFPGLGKELWLCQTEQGAWNGQTRPGHVQGASQAVRKVKFRCVWIRIWTSLSCSCASQGLLMGSVHSEVLWEQIDGQCRVGPDVKKVPETCHHICLSPQITLSPQVLGSPGDLLQ